MLLCGHSELRLRVCEKGLLRGALASMERPWCGEDGAGWTQRMLVAKAPIPHRGTGFRAGLRFIREATDATWEPPAERAR